MRGLALKLKLDLENGGEIEEERIRVETIVQAGSHAPRIQTIDVIH